MQTRAIQTKSKVNTRENNGRKSLRCRALQTESKSRVKTRGEMVEKVRDVEHQRQNPKPKLNKVKTMAEKSKRCRALQQEK